ncbi:peptide MFS transporter [Thiotrichales bacterium 19S3-7]|nr:peptide MFS transporter [Thiotrichales bacterium 19S3-7]MCF6801676.1 peptide MFS transporter [Thiotrichales bacterium 19S3-11]
MSQNSDQVKVLTISSLTEFGERYGYYVIQSLLIFFLIERFNISQHASASLVGTVLAMIYISALVGGYIADKLINYYRAAFLGSIFMIIGSSILALSTSENMMFLGLAFISISTGLIKSNISSFIGRFYDQSGLSDSHRDFGFNIFYVGINLGSFFALFVASALKDSYGFSAPFYSSIIVSIFMLSLLCIGFFILKRYIASVKLTLKKLTFTVVIICLYIAVVYALLRLPEVANLAILLAAVLAVLIMVVSAQKKYWRQVIVAGIFYLLSILYWALYFQIFISILLFIAHCVDHSLFGITINNSQFLSVESLGVLIFGAVMGKIWLTFGKRGMPVNDIDKFNVAFVIMTLMFILFYFSIAAAPSDAKIPAIIIVVGFLMLSISELSLSAIGLSLVTKIAPPKYVSLYMGIWLVTIGLGGKIAGLISAHITISANVVTSKANMNQGMLVFIGLAIIGMIICFLTRKLIIKTAKSLAV